MAEIELVHIVRLVIDIKRLYDFEPNSGFHKRVPLINTIETKMINNLKET